MPEETNALLSSAMEGRARTVQWLPSVFAVNAGLPAVGLLSVSAKTTWRLRRSDSLCASRRPFWSASLTARTLLLRTHSIIDGAASIMRMASKVTVIMSSISVKPGLRRQAVFRPLGRISTIAPSSIPMRSCSHSSRKRL
ncbi:hypothetical protein D9M68_904580 [compost metagenome]